MPPSTARRRLLLLTLAIALACAAAVALLPHDPAEMARLMALPAPLLVAAAIAAWTVLTPALVSGTLLAAGTGLVLGTATGMPVALLGATLGSVAAFFVARRLGRGPADALAGPRLTRLRERVEQRPLLTIVLARLAPGSPATILNYAAGLTRIRPRHFVAGILIGGAPRVLAYTAFGAAAAEHALWPAIAGVGLLGVLGVAGTVVVRRRHAAAARRALP
jgi:phospholipase D1/2